VIGDPQTEVGKLEEISGLTLQRLPLLCLYSWSVTARVAFSECFGVDALLCEVFAGPDGG
jgi:hypothetical protein